MFFIVVHDRCQESFSRRLFCCAEVLPELLTIGDPFAQSHSCVLENLRGPFRYPLCLLDGACAGDEIVDIQAVLNQLNRLAIGWLLMFEVFFDDRSQHVRAAVQPEWQPRPLQLDDFRLWRIDVVDPQEPKCL